MRRYTQCLVPVLLNRSSSVTIRQQPAHFDFGRRFVDQVARRSFGATSLARGSASKGANRIMEPQEHESTVKRVLSIQSHVVHGYVGNKSATFPLQVLGFEVDGINSVQFSNHTGYDFIKGQVLSDKELDDIIVGLQQNHLLDGYSHLLTGYIGKDSFLRKVADAVKKLREANPKLVYVCDPVMGDNGQLYVPATLLPIYKDEIIPLADICTPNQFEMELLTGQTIKTEADAWKAMQWFHDRGVATVALSSTDLGAPEELLAFVSHHKGNVQLRYSMTIPKQGVNVNFTGTGDLFASLFLAHSSLSPNLKMAFENTVATLQAVITNTLQRMPEAVRLNARPVQSRDRELKIVQSKADIERPNVQLLAHAVHIAGGSYENNNTELYHHKA